jgi:hypothetical protein
LANSLIASGRDKEKVESRKKERGWKHGQAATLFGRPVGQHLEIPQTFVPHSNLSPRSSTYWPKAKKQKILSLFPFSKFIFYFFLKFLIFGNANVETLNMLWKRRKMKHWWIFGEREYKNANGRRRAENHIWENY